jgi:hypothetical protein
MASFRYHLPRELSGFEIEAFFTFTASERALIEARRGASLKLGLALQIGFLRMTGRVLDAVRIVPPALWKHLGNQFGEQGPDLASLRAMYRRHRTLFDHQDLARACSPTPSWPGTPRKCRRSSIAGRNAVAVQSRQN